jgi:hypothetical protein
MKRRRAVPTAMQKAAAHSLYREDVAYRGYLIRYNALRDSFNINKYSYHICYCASIIDGKRVIDQLLGGSA